MFWVVFVIAFIICAIVLRTIVNGFMSLMGADIYSFSVSGRAVICAVIAFIAAFLITG